MTDKGLEHLKGLTKLQSLNLELTKGDRRRDARTSKRFSPNWLISRIDVPPPRRVTVPTIAAARGFGESSRTEQSWQEAASPSPPRPHLFDDVEHRWAGKGVVGHAVRAEGESFLLRVRILGTIPRPHLIRSCNDCRSPKNGQGRVFRKRPPSSSARK